MLMSCKRSYNKKGICSNKLNLEGGACHGINKQRLLSNSTAEETVAEFWFHQALSGSVVKQMRWNKVNVKTLM